ncbi:MAG: hypothetical protein DRN68_08255 [Thaumarchaeota archaeon]|nr:MAG: hypothetical protein DRN68_08255 [Nitrososphaerota archaeon]
MSSSLFLGTDIGTYGTKSCLVDAEGKVLAESFVETDVIIPKPGWAEQWPDVWWNAYIRSVKEVLKKSGIKPEDITSICISGLNSGSGIPVDKEFKPLRPGIIWMDRRAVEEVEWVKKEIGEEEIFKKTGNVIDPYYGFTKILWIKRNEPEIWRKTHKLLTAYGYVIYKLTGSICMDQSSAGVLGGIYDMHKRDWSEELMEELGIPRQLFPEKIVWSKDIVGEVTKEAAEITGLRKGIPVAAGGVDAPVSALSVGALNDGDLASMIGTSMCNGFIQDELRLSKKLVNSPHVAYDDKKLYSFTGIATAGAVVKWFRDELSAYEKLFAERMRTSAYKFLDKMAEEIPPGADCLIFTPHMTVGERAPYWNPYLRSCLFGLNLYHTKAHLFRAFLEGVAYAIKDCIEAAMEAGIPLRKAILVDGGARSPLWRQIIADVTGVEFTYIEGAIGAPLGDALLAGVGVGELKYEDILKWVEEGKIVKPNPRNVKIYEKYYMLYRRVREDLQESYRMAAELMKKC